MAAPNDFQVFISHGRKDERIQPRVVEVIEALNAVPAIRPRIDRYLDPDGALVKGIAFITDGSPWRDRIEEAMYSVDAAIVCLDPISAASTWVRYEATILRHRSRAEPGFRVFYLHDGELFRSPDEEQWSHWDPLRPQDRQITKWSDLGNLVAEIRSVAATYVRSTSQGQDRLLGWLKRDLNAACALDRALLGNLLDSVRGAGFPLADSINAALVESGSTINEISAEWVVGTYVHTLIECRRQGWSLAELAATVGIGADALDAVCADDTLHRSKVFRDLLVMLPTEAEIEVARRCFDPGPAPPRPARQAADARQSDPVPIFLDTSFAGVQGTRPHIDVRLAIGGQRPKAQTAPTGKPDHLEYLRDVLCLATGTPTSGQYRQAKVPIFPTGDPLDVLGMSMVDVLRGAIDRSAGSAVSPDDYCMADDRARRGEVLVGHVVVACDSLRFARRVLREIEALPAEDDARRPRCTVVLDVSRATDRSEVAGFDPPTGPVAADNWLRLDGERISTRAADQSLIGRLKKASHDRNE